MGFPNYEPDEDIITKLVMDDPLVRQMYELLHSINNLINDGKIVINDKKIAELVQENCLELLDEAERRFRV